MVQSKPLYTPSLRFGKMAFLRSSDSFSVLLIGELKVLTPALSIHTISPTRKGGRILSRNVVKCPPNYLGSHPRKHYRPYSYIILYRVVKDKAIPLTSREGQYDCEISRLKHVLDNGLTDCGEVVSLTRRPPFTPRKVLRAHFY
jgi:hypothetical protein